MLQVKLLSTRRPAMAKKSKEFERGFIKACELIRTINYRSWDWHIKTFGENGAHAGDYASWARKKLRRMK